MQVSVLALRVLLKATAVLFEGEVVKLPRLMNEAEAEVRTVVERICSDALFGQLNSFVKELQRNVVRGQC